jgi:RecG-like helicase
VTLSGKIDRVLGNGAYVVANAENAKSPTERILIFTEPQSKPIQSKRQQAGVAVSRLKEGDRVKVYGKVEQFNVSNEMDSFKPMRDSETVRESVTSSPILVIQPGGMQKG